MRQGAGIDRQSSAADVQAAFRGQGIDLILRPDGSAWQAFLRPIPGTDEHQSGARADSPDEAARRAWQRHLEEHGTTGAS